MYQAWRRYRYGNLQTGAGFVVPAAVSGGYDPVNGFLDRFNRADENPLATGTWTTGVQSGDSAIQIVSNQVQMTAEPSGATWNTSFNADQEVYMTISGSSVLVMAWRLTNAGASNVTGYLIYIFNDGTNKMRVYRVDDTSTLALQGGDLSQSLTSGDKVRVKHVGSTITVSHYTGSGPWALVDTRTSGTYSGSGKIGLQLYPSGVADDFGGGNI